MCNTECQQQSECLAWAGTREYGVWGGLTRSKRIKLKRRGGPTHKCPECGSLNTAPLEGTMGQCGECGTVV